MLFLPSVGYSTYYTCYCFTVIKITFTGETNIEGTAVAGSKLAVRRSMQP